MGRGFVANATLAEKDKGSSVEDGIEDPQSHSLELEDSDHIEDLKRSRRL